MKVNKSFLLFTSNLKLGGAQRNVALMANELAKNNKVIIFTFANDENLYLFGKNVQILQCNSSLLILIQRLYMIMSRTKVTHTVIFNYTFLFIIPMLYLKSDVSLRFINNYKKQKKSKFRAIYYSIGIYLTRPLITCYVAQCESMKKEMQAKLGSGANIKVIFNPIVRRPVEKNKDIDFIFVGKLTHQKDPLIALKELARFKEKHGPFNATFVGDGYLRDEFIATIRKLGFSNEISWFDQHDCAVDLIAKAKVLLLTSRYEGFPNVLLEAIACYVPTVAYMSKHGITEIITHPELGYVYEPECARTTDDFVDQLRVFRDKTINTEIYDKKLDSFSIQKYSEQLRQVFE